jgi:hypothetical protein
VVSTQSTTRYRKAIFFFFFFFFQLIDMFQLSEQATIQQQLAAH